MAIKFDEEYDIVIIGGGAIGSSIALDSSSRTYKVLLVEQNDFASGTSSKSTKLLHGGVRYLEKAINELNLKQYQLVNEALEERSHFLKKANHISSKIKLLSPTNKWYELVYYYIGLKIYDFISRSKSIGKTTIKLYDEFNTLMPTINKNKSKWAVEYYDGSFNDSKLVIDILKSAQNFGAVVKNYTNFDSFIYEDGKIIGLKLFDKIENKTLFIKASCVFNATGHYVDNIRKIDNASSLNITTLSKGSHIVISNDILNIKEGLLIPKTKDKRVIFVLPWLNYCLIGTTEIKVDFETNPSVTKEEKEYLLNHLNEYFDVNIQLNEVLSSWSGIRTLIKDEIDSKSIVREHIIEVSKSNLISICGGKWTTSRKIAEDALLKALQKKIIYKRSECKTKKIDIAGSFENKEKLSKELESYNLAKDINEHLINTYGKESLTILLMSKNEDDFERIIESLPYTKLEILYSIKYEYVKKPMDYLARRVRIAFLDKNTCKICIEYVAKVIKEFYFLDEDSYNNLLFESYKELDEFF